MQAVQRATEATAATVALETRGGDAGKQTHLLTRDMPTRLPAIYRRLDFLLIAIVWPGPLRVVCHERAVCVERCETVREMKEGPSRPAVRCRSQATASCCRQERWWCCVKKARERHAVREMKEDPSEPSCRGGLQTAMSCFGQKLR
jgi:hypothetical protein